MLLSAWDLLAVIREPQPYMLPIISRWLPKIVVPREHHVLKNLPFYEEAREADTKARQERLKQREEKRQEGTLRKTSGEKGQSSSFIACPRAKKKKKSFAKVVEVLPLVLASPSASTRFIPSPLDGYDPNSRGDLDPLRCDLDPPRSDSNPQSSEPELVVPDIIYESEVEKEMAANLTTGFGDRMHKRLSKPIEVVVPLAKRPHPDEVHKEPITEVSLVPILPSNVAGSSSVLPAASPVREETCLAKDGAQDDPTPAVEDTDQKGTLSCAAPPSWEKMKEMLGQMPCFIGAESPLTKMLDFFPLTKRI